MKTTSILLTSVFFCFTLGLFSATINNPTGKQEGLFKQISNTVDYPQHVSMDKQATVTVRFEVADNGKIIVKEINGQPDFVTNVKAKLENFVVKKFKDLVGEDFYYRFSFKKD